MRIFLNIIDNDFLQKRTCSLHHHEFSRGFYFRELKPIRENSENKNLAKIKESTVPYQSPNSSIQHAKKSWISYHKAEISCM